MIRKILLSFASVWCLVQSSGVHHNIQAPLADAPVVTAASSQFFERTFNRLIAAPQLVPVAAAPATIPIAPTPQYFNIAPAPPVLLQPVQPQQAPLPPVPQVFSIQPVQPTQSAHVPTIKPTTQPDQPEPNVSISIATANAAAPVATILLPPYPFGLPPGFGFIHQDQPSKVDEKSQEPEQTTTRSTTQMKVKTTTRESEATTPLPAASDTDFSQILPPNQNVNFKQNFAPRPQHPRLTPNQNVNFKHFSKPGPQQPQGVPSNQNINFKQYFAPQQFPNQPSNVNVNNDYLPPFQQQPLPLEPPRHQYYDHHHEEHRPHSHIHLHKLSHGKPQKLKTVVEVVKAPLSYIAPEPINYNRYPHNYEAIKVVKHVHTFIPTKARLVIRPVSHHHTRSVPVKVIEYKPHFPPKRIARVQNVRPEDSREIEFTTPRIFTKNNTKPPKLYSML